MPRPCESCRHPKADIINRKLKQDVTLGDISRWLKSEGDEFYLSTAALGRHRAHVIPDKPAKRGAKPYAGDFLELVRDTAAQAVADGEAKVSVQHGLQAQQQLDARVARDKFNDLARIAFLALTGQTLPDMIEGEYTEVDDETEQEFQKLLAAGQT